MRIGHLVACASLLGSSTASAFSQSSPVFPIGHEAVTVIGAHNSAGFRALPKPILTANQVAQKNLCLRYGAVDPRVCAVVLGDRWVDIMGFNLEPFKPVLSTKLYDYTSDFKCFLSVAQDQDAIQYDHFLRKEADEGEAGRQRAYGGSLTTYRNLVGMAVRAEETWRSDVTDGAIERTSYKDVPMSYFLLGRAMHLLQDSFSPEHAQRYVKREKGRAVSSIVIDLASYRCIAGTYKEHTHDKQVRMLHEGVIGQFAIEHGAVSSLEHGDLIWTSAASTNEKDQLAVLLKGDTRNPTYVSTYIKTAAMDAADASSDLFDTFLSARAARAAGRKADADKAIEAHVQKWFALSKKGMPVTSTAASLAECRKIMEPMDKIVARRDACLKQTGTNIMPGEKHKPPFGWVGKVDNIE